MTRSFTATTSFAAAVLTLTAASFGRADAPLTGRDVEEFQAEAVRIMAGYEAELERGGVLSLDSIRERFTPLIPDAEHALREFPEQLASVRNELLPAGLRSLAPLGVSANRLGLFVTLRQSDPVRMTSRMGANRPMTVCGGVLFTRTPEAVRVEDVSLRLSRASDRLYRYLWTC